MCVSTIFSTFFAGREFDSVPEIVVVQADLIRDAELLAVEFEFVAVDDVPKRSLG